MTFRALVVSVAAAVWTVGAAGCGGDDVGESAPEPIVASIPEALVAVEEFYGGPQEYFEVSVSLEGVGFVVAVDAATAAEQGSWTPDGGLVGPEPVGEASGETFTADEIDVDADTVFDRLRDELGDPVIVDFAVQGGPDDTVIYDATVASDSGGVLLVLLGADGTIIGVQGR